MTWFLVECLGVEPEMTIVAKDGERRDWISLRHTMRTEGIDSEPILTWIRSSGSHFREIVHGKQGDRLIEAVPILGVEGDVYAVHLWIGTPTEIAPKPRPAAGISWTLGDLQIRQRLESWLMSTDDAAGFKGIRSPGEFYRKVLRFDDRPALVALAINPVAGERFESSIHVLHDNGNLMNWDVVARGRADEHHYGVRGLTHDITDVRPPSIGALENLGLTIEPGDDDPAAALLAFPPRSAVPIISNWIGKVPTWIDWQREGDSVLFHPDDCPAIRRTSVVLEPAVGSDNEVTTRARIRAHTPSGWQAIDLKSRRYPGDVGKVLHIVRIIKVTET
jgi:hypothetical protein